MCLFVVYCKMIERYKLIQTNTVFVFIKNKIIFFHLRFSHTTNARLSFTAFLSERCATLADS